VGHVLFQTPVLICLRLCCVVFVFLISFSVSFVPLSLVFFVFFFSLLRPFYTQENLSCSSYKRVTSHREGEDMGEEEEGMWGVILKSSQVPTLHSALHTNTK
jgi:hypothetical protein